MRQTAFIAIVLATFLPSHSAFAASDWTKTVTSPQRGGFPDPRPLQATYHFGWNSVVAATAEVDFDKRNGQLELVGNGGTIGIVRSLWPFDVQQRAVADALTLRPIHMHQVDEVRNKIITTDLVFDAKGVIRTRTDTKAKKPPTPKNFNFPGLLDLHSALLFIRSQPLVDGSVQRIVVYPATNAYLATITVVGHEKVTVGAGTYPAIKLDLQLKKIGKKGELEPHRKFRRASVWLSDDADRLLLRIEAGVFVGTVFVDLEAVHFPGAKP
ncbi:MAG TPA: DUF3108 domain-containing protein [Chthoniobacterales bacterium]